MIIIIAGACGIFYGLIWGARENSFWRSIFKTLPVALLAIGSGFALLVEQGSTFLFAALVFSAAGDAFLSRSGERMFIAGLGSFLIAHILFVLLFFAQVGSDSNPQWKVMLVVVVCGVLIVGVLTNLWRYLGPMKIPVVLYTVVIAVMVICAWVTEQGMVLLVGVTLFALSDTVLAHDLFYPLKENIKKLAAHFVWFSYLAAQILITVSFI